MMLLHQSFAACRRLGLVFVACTLATFAINQASSQLPPFSELFPERDKLSELLPLAEKGDARAQFQLGTKYLRGRGIAKNPAEALRWLRASGEQGFAKAQLYLGNHYTDVAKDDSTALVWFRRAADNLTEREGVIGARKAGAILSRDPRTASEAATYFRRAAEQGDLQAKVLLGTMYLDGSGVDRNFPEGVKWIEQASTDRYDLPKYVLTFIFAEGFGTPPDVQEAAARLSGVRKERTEAGASYFIATFYHRGFRVDKEDRPILTWVFKHMGSGDESVRRYFDRQRVGSGYRWADEDGAIAWYRKAAELGDIGAEVNLGLIHFESRGSKWDCAEGMKWTRKAADRGDPTAQLNLGSFYRQGPYRSTKIIGLTGENVPEGVKVEAVEADGPASRAGLRVGDIIISLNGSSLDTYGIEDLEGATNLRPILKLLVKRSGEDTARSIDIVPQVISLTCPGTETLGLRADAGEAFRWFEKSAAGGHASGRYFLAGAYREGKGTLRDPVKAMELYRKGADLGDWQAAQAISEMYANGEGVEKSKELSEHWFSKAVRLRHQAIRRH